MEGTKKEKEKKKKKNVRGRVGKPNRYSSFYVWNITREKNKIGVHDQGLGAASSLEDSSSSGGGGGISASCG
jgi:hypothetical protein